MAFDPGIVGSLGALFYIGTTAVDPTTDTYTIVNYVRDIGPFGRNYSIVNFTNLADGAVQKFKGEFNDGDVRITVGRDIADPGQAAMFVARDYTGPKYYNFETKLNDASGASGSLPTHFWFKGKVTQFLCNINNTQQVVLGDITIAIKSGSIQEVAPT
jgi:hypothetical protein